MLSYLPTLLGLLAVATGPDEPLKPFDIYSQEEAAFFSRHRVREIVVLRQGYYDGHQGTRRTLSVQQFDRRGRVTKEWKHPSEGRFLTLEESTYDAAGRLTDRTTYNNASPAADTSRLGTAWQPASRAHYPVANGQTGYGDQWNRHTNSWQRAEASRRWSSHDTTYVQITRLPDATSGSLARTYPAPGERTRFDYMLTGNWVIGGLTEPQYAYTRQEQGRQMEAGVLHFEDDLRAYLAQHPQASQPEAGTEAYYHLLDQVARHAAGRPEPSSTRTYDAQGRLLKDAAKYFFTTYQRNDQGRVQSTQEYIQNVLTAPPVPQDHTVFGYLPNGLVDHEEVTGATLGLEAIRYYRYRYY